LRRKYLKTDKPSGNPESGNTGKVPEKETASLASNSQEDTTRSPYKTTTLKSGLPKPAKLPIPAPTIHFTVRLMMATRKRKCHVLRNWMTHKDDEDRVLWTRFPLDDQNVSGQLVQRRLFEDELGLMELDLLQNWVTRPEKLALSGQVRRPRILRMSKEPGLDSILKPYLKTEKDHLNEMYLPRRRFASRRGRARGRSQATT